MFPLHSGLGWIRALSTLTFQRRVRLTLVFALLPLALISEPIPAFATPQSNFTFKLRAFDGSAVSGATVGVTYEINGVYKFETATSGLDGDAHFALSNSAIELHYFAMPSVNDTQNAVIVRDGWSMQAFELSSQSRTINFGKRDVRVLVTSSDGVTPVDQAWLYLQTSFKGSSFPLIRPGAFNLAFQDLYNRGITPQSLHLYRSNLDGSELSGSALNDFPWAFGITRESSGTHKIFTDLKKVAEVPSRDGVSILQFGAPNLLVRFKNSDSTDFRFPGYETSGPTGLAPGSVAVYPINASGESTSDGDSGEESYSQPRLSGEAYGLVTGVRTGRYRIHYTNNGSWIYPSITRDFYIDSSGAISLSPSGPYVNRALHEIDLIPRPGTIFKYKIVDGLGTFLDGNVTLRSKTSGETFNEYTNSGKGMVQLNADLYDVTMRTEGNWERVYRYTLDLRSSSVSLTESGGQIISIDSSDSSFALSTPSPNVRFLAVDELDTNTIIASYYYITRNGEHVSGSSVGNFKLEDGTGYSVYIYPHYTGNSTFSEQRFAFDVINGAAVVAGISAQDGVHRLPMKRPNFKFNLISPFDSSNVSGWLHICGVSASGDDSRCKGAKSSSMSGGSTYLADGTYDVEAYAHGSSLLSNKFFRITISQGMITSSPFALQDGRLQIVFDRPNLTGSVHSSITDTTIAFGEPYAPYGVDLHLQKLQPGGYWEGTKYNSWLSSSSNFGFSINEPGEYQIIARPQGSDDIVTTRSKSFFVNDSGALSETATGTYFPTLSNFIIRLETPNVQVRLFNEESGEPLRRSHLQLYQVSGGSKYFFSGGEPSPGTLGLYKFRLPDGQYEIHASPSGDDSSTEGLTKRTFAATVSGGIPNISLAGVAISPDTSGVFPLRFQKGNLKGRVIDLGGNPAICETDDGDWRYVHVELQRQVPGTGIWQYAGWIPFNCYSARFFHDILTAGTYRVRLEPHRFQNESFGYSSPFVVSETAISTKQRIDLGDVSLGRPTIRLAVTTNSPDSRLANVPILIQGERFGAWFYTGRTGIANVSVELAGEYSVEVHPSEEAREQGATRARYQLIATTDTNGKVVATVSPGPGVTNLSQETLTVLRLGIPNLKGVVHAPDSPTIGVSDAWVVPIDSATSRELWDYSVQSNSTGRWSISLPQGTYQLEARAPWANSDYGHGPRIGTVVVDSIGAVTLTGKASESRTTETFGMPLGAPRWKGQVFEPSMGETPSQIAVPFPYICLVTNREWTCTMGDRNGRWALTPNYDFQGFSEDTFLEIQDRNGRYPLLRYLGPDEVSSRLGGLTNQAVRLEMRNTNYEVVVKANGLPVKGAWVSLTRDKWGGDWLGSATTDASGKAKFVLSSADSVTIIAEPNGNRDFALDFTRTAKDAVGNSSSTPLSVEVDLATPNFRGILREPADSPTVGSPALGAYLSVYNVTKQFWSAGASTDELGRFVLNLERPSDGSSSYEYSITAHPSWQSTSDATRNRYTVVVMSNDSMTVYLKDYIDLIAPVETVTGRSHYRLSLGSPSVTGIVVTASGEPVRDSYILPIESQQKRWYWDNATNSRINGNFSLDIPDGSYHIQAKKPWHVKESADSRICDVVVLNGAVQSHGESCEDGTEAKRIKLTLREPNTKFRLVDAQGNPVQNAYVGVAYGNWHTWAYSNDMGSVSLFIDTEAIELLNGYWMKSPTVDSEIAFHVWVNPPWGSSSIDMVQWGCSVNDDSKPICAQLPSASRGTPYPGGDFGTITVLGSNTTISVFKPISSDSNVTAVKANFNTWVYVYELNSNCTKCRSWVGGTHLNPNGQARFRLSEDAGKLFAVEVYPSWEDRNTFARKYHDNNGLGYTRAQLQSTQFDLGAPNFFIRVFAPDGVSPSKWAWIGIEVIDSVTAQTISGYQGIQVDRTGRGGVLLEPSQTYRLSIYPGNGSVGSTTQCVVRADSAGVVSTVASQCWNATMNNSNLQLSLSSGNVTGIVMTPSGPLSGAVVYANFQETMTTSVVATTNAQGAFGLELGSKETWTVTIIPLTNDGSASPYKAETRTVTSQALKDAQGANPPYVSLGAITLVTRP